MKRVRNLIAIGALAAGCGEAFQAPVLTSDGGGVGGASATSTAGDGSTTSASVTSAGGASTASTGGGSTASAGGGSMASASVTSTGVTSTTSTGCTPTRTCDDSFVHCGLLDDGCGTLLDCGDFEKNVLCDFPHVPSYNCKCPEAMPWGWQCVDDGAATADTQPFADGCIINPVGAGYGWCCTEGS